MSWQLVLARAAVDVYGCEGFSIQENDKLHFLHD